jgi:hypothetical protein
MHPAPAHQNTNANASVERNFQMSSVPGFIVAILSPEASLVEENAELVLVSVHLYLMPDVAS